MLVKTFSKPVLLKQAEVPLALGTNTVTKQGPFPNHPLIGGKIEEQVVLFGEEQSV